jgi:hypothetical protein
MRKSTMRIVLFPASAMLVMVCSSFTAAQSPMPAPPFGPTHVGGDERPDAPTKDDFKRIPHPQRQFGPVHEKRVLTKGSLAPAAQEVAGNVAFLKQADTGLFKLRPREKVDWQPGQDAKHVKLRGGGAYYSFFYLSHDNIYGADLDLDHNSLGLDFKEPDYGILIDMGDLPLNEVSADDSRAAFIAGYKPARRSADARCEIKKFRAGVAVNASLSKLSLPVKVNSTYLLRSINYGRSDLLVGFRVMRQDSDGSVTIAWKLLKQYWRPVFEKVIYVNPTDPCPIK